MSYTTKINIDYIDNINFYPNLSPIGYYGLIFNALDSHANRKISKLEIGERCRRPELNSTQQSTSQSPEGG